MRRRRHVGGFSCLQDSSIEDLSSVPRIKDATFQLPEYLQELIAESEQEFYPNGPPPLAFAAGAAGVKAQADGATTGCQATAAAQPLKSTALVPPVGGQLAPLEQLPCGPCQRIAWEDQGRLEIGHSRKAVPDESLGAQAGAAHTADAGDGGARGSASVTLPVSSCAPRRLPVLLRRGGQHHSKVKLERVAELATPMPQHTLAAFPEALIGRIQRKIQGGVGGVKPQGGIPGERTEDLVEMMMQRKLKRWLAEVADGSKYLGVGEFYEFTKTIRFKKKKNGRYLYIDEPAGRILAPGADIVEQAIRMGYDQEHFMQTKEDWPDFTEEFRKVAWEKEYGLPALSPNLWWFCDKTRYFMLVKEGSPFALVWDGHEDHDAAKIVTSDLEIMFEPERKPSVKRVLIPLERDASRKALKEPKVRNRVRRFNEPFHIPRSFKLAVKYRHIHCET